MKIVINSIDGNYAITINGFAKINTINDWLKTYADFITGMSLLF
jgi:hypothetical protein